MLGKVYSGSILNSLICQLFFNPELLSVLEHMLQAGEGDLDRLV